MSIPNELKYSKTHEWVREEGGKAKIGITEHAAEELGDLVFVELPEVGDAVRQGESFAVVESVKATSDVLAPIGGIVAAVNDALEGSPEAVNTDSYAAWFVELEAVQPNGELMTAEQYEKFLAEAE